MKIYVPNHSNTNIGGGWTFLKNFKKAAAKADIELVDSINDADLLFGFGPTVIAGEDIERAKNQNKPFVLRMDGVPEDNRNSGKGTRRMVEYAKKADFIIYQTNFVNETVGETLRNLGVEAPSRVVYNGVDREIFKDEGPTFPMTETMKILHVNYRKDTNKRVEEVIQMYREVWNTSHDCKLLLMGRYPTEWIQYGMGFYAGENYQTIGVVTDDNAKAMYMRSCDVFFYPSYADPAPNVVLEAMACGLPILYNPYGGVKELVGEHAGMAIDFEKYGSYGEMLDILREERHGTSYAATEQIASKFTLERMIANYKEVFEGVLEQ